MAVAQRRAATGREMANSGRYVLAHSLPHNGGHMRDRRENVRILASGEKGKIRRVVRGEGYRELIEGVESRVEERDVFTRAVVARTHTSGVTVGSVRKGETRQRDSHSSGGGH